MNYQRVPEPEDDGKEFWRGVTVVALLIIGAWVVWGMTQ